MEGVREAQTYAIKCGDQSSAQQAAPKKGVSAADAYAVCEAQWEVQGNADATSEATMTQAQFNFLKKCMRQRGQDFWIGTK
jgi:hypothetical protein